jgi:hypothetical protein
MPIFGTRRKPVAGGCLRGSAVTDISILFPPPYLLQRCAWECALDLGQEDPAFIANGALLDWLQDIVRQPEESFSWAECASLFRFHRHYRPVRA